MKIKQYSKKFHLITAIIWIYLISSNEIFSQIIISAHDVSCHGCTDGYAGITVVAATPPYEVLWPDGSTSAFHDNLAPGIYEVTITDANQCTGVARITINDKPETPDDFTISVVTSMDPNDINGPSGYSDSRWVSVNDVLPYVIRFENDPVFATAAVNKVVITHPIDDMANMFTFQLGEITFRDTSIQIPPNTSHYFKRLDLTDSMNVYLDITAGIDVTKKQAFWILQAFDPVTGLPNINPDLGFLLINDSITHNGEGSVSFSIKPKNDAVTGDTIHAFANIVFDVNAPIPTNITFNTIDAGQPVSKVKSITTISSDIVEINWDGNDDPNGSGIADYKLLISSNDEPYSSYADISGTSIIVDLQGGNEYKIQTVANDHTNNTEQLKVIADTVFYIIPVVKLGKDLSICVGDSVELNAGSGFNSYLWNDGSTNQKLKIKTAGKYYVTAIKDTVTASDTIVVGISQLPVPSLHSNISAFCEGESLILNAGPGYKNYSWNNGEETQTIEINNPGKYSVSVTDNNKCQGEDSISVMMFNIPEISLGNDTMIMDNDSVVLATTPDDFIFYQWNDNSIDDEFMVIGKNATIGNNEFWVRVTDANNCSNSDTINITVQSTIIIDIENAEHTKIYLYPNPVYDKMNLQLEGIESGDLRLDLYNMEGILLMNKKYDNGKAIVTDQIDMSNLSPGSYLIRITYADHEIMKTIIKQ